MRASRILVLVVGAALFGLLVAVVLSRGELISVRIWLIAAAVGIGATILVRLIVVASVEPARLVVAWRSPLRPHRRPRRHGIRDLRSTEAILLAATDNARIHAVRLRPRLTALADHYLPIRRGIDVGRDPDQATALFGDVAWLTDPGVTDRAPTHAEIHEFLDVILVDDEPMVRGQPLDDDAGTS